MAESGIKSYFPSQTVSDAEKLADSILRKVLGVDVAHNYNKTGKIYEILNEF